MTSETKPYLISPVCLQEQDVVWLEVFDHGKGEYCVIHCTVKWIEPGGLCAVDDTGYGHYCKIDDFNEGHKRATFGWRCWNVCPTKERMEGVPWND